MTSDIRIASPAAQFGVPIARTLGNTLSAEVLDLALRHFGRSRTTDMILNARHFSADEMRSCGFVSEVHEDVSHAAAAVVQRILRHAPLTMWATKELIRRLQSTAESIDDEDVLSRVYGSADFSNGDRFAYEDCFCCAPRQAHCTNVFGMLAKTLTGCFDYRCNRRGPTAF